MLFNKKRKFTASYLLKNLLIIIGIVLIWRGIWYLLDMIDVILFGKSHLITAIIGIILGFVFLYIPNKDLSEIERL